MSPFAVIATSGQLETALAIIRDGINATTPERFEWAARFIAVDRAEAIRVLLQELRPPSWKRANETKTDRYWALVDRAARLKADGMSVAQIQMRMTADRRLAAEMSGYPPPRKVARSTVQGYLAAAKMGRVSG
jgi:hypothetical protein